MSDLRERIIKEIRDYDDTDTYSTLADAVLAVVTAHMAVTDAYIRRLEETRDELATALYVARAVNDKLKAFEAELAQANAKCERLEALGSYLMTRVFASVSDAGGQ